MLQFWVMDAGLPYAGSYDRSKCARGLTAMGEGGGNAGGEEEETHSSLTDRQKAAIAAQSMRHFTVQPYTHFICVCRPCTHSQPLCWTCANSQKMMCAVTQGPRAAEFGRLARDTVTGK